MMMLIKRQYDHSDSDTTTFKVKKSKVNLQGRGHTCGSLPHSLLCRTKQLKLQCSKPWGKFSVFALSHCDFLDEPIAK